MQAAVSADLAAAIVQGYSDYWTVEYIDCAIQTASESGSGQRHGGYRAQAALGRYLLNSETLAKPPTQADVKHQIWITQRNADSGNC